MTVANAQIVKVQQAQFIACAYVYEGPSGTWIVQDEMDSRGGLFTDRKAALKFARHEFGLNTKIVMAAPVSSSDAKSTAKPGQLRFLNGGQQAPQTNMRDNTMFKAYENANQSESNVFDRLESKCSKPSSSPAHMYMKGLPALGSFRTRWIAEAVFLPTAKRP